MWKDADAGTKVKIVGLAVLGLIVFLFLYNSLIGGRMGYGYNPYYGQGVSPNLNGAVAPVLILIIKILSLVFTVSLIVGAALVVKKYMFEDKKLNLSFLEGLVSTGSYQCPSCNTRLGTEFNYCPTCKASLKESCGVCGKELKISWTYCPACGEPQKRENH